MDGKVSFLTANSKYQAENEYYHLCSQGQIDHKNRYDFGSLEKGLALDAFGGVSRFLESEPQIFRFCQILIANLKKETQMGLESVDKGGLSCAKRKQQITYISDDVASQYLNQREPRLGSDKWALISRSWDTFSGRVSTPENDSKQEANAVQEELIQETKLQKDALQKFGLVCTEQNKGVKIQPEHIAHSFKTGSAQGLNKGKEHSGPELLDFSLICRHFDEVLAQRSKDMSLEVGLREMLRDLETLVFTLKNLHN